MARYVCAGAKLKCSMGSQQSDLVVIPCRRSLVRIKGNLMATIMDHKPFVNIKPFGQCQSLANPTVASATAACNGKLQKMPCVPNIVAPWVGGKPRVRICGEPTLLDNSKLSCVWTGMIEITDPGQDFVKDGGAVRNSRLSSIESEKKTKDVAVVTGSAGESEARETEDVAKITVKDFVEILEKIEEKQGYEAARHYASNNINYWTINELAKKYVNETDAEKKDKQKDNDPNLMPSRFMLLYGAEDGKLKRIDDHPDNFEGQEPHKICVKKLREALRLMGHEDVKEDGSFDAALYCAYFRYLRRYGRVNIGGLYENEDDAEKPRDELADKYGVFTWKYFQDREESGAPTDHDHIIEELSPEYGDGLLAEKGVDPREYKPGVSYHYPWVPFSLTLRDRDGEDDGNGENKKSNDETSKYEIIDTNSGTLLASGDVDGDKIELLLPDAEDVSVFVDGEEISMNPVRPEITEEEEVSDEPEELLLDKALTSFDGKGIKYGYGSMTMSSMDCSGLINAAMFGIDSGRKFTTGMWDEKSAEYGWEMIGSDINNAQRGDILLWTKRNGNKHDHMGFYVDSATIFHASVSNGVANTNNLQTYWIKNSGSPRIYRKKTQK